MVNKDVYIINREQKDDRIYTGKTDRNTLAHRKVQL